jgi:hypothetical protein
MRDRCDDHGVQARRAPPGCGSRGGSLRVSRGRPTRLAPGGVALALPEPRAIPKGRQLRLRLGNQFEWCQTAPRPTKDDARVCFPVLEDERAIPAGERRLLGKWPRITSCGHNDRKRTAKSGKATAARRGLKEPKRPAYEQTAVCGSRYFHAGDRRFESGWGYYYYYYYYSRSSCQWGPFIGAAARRPA